MLLKKTHGDELRKNFEKEAIKLSSGTPFILSNRTILEDFKELSPEIKVDEIDELRFGLFKPIFFEENTALANSRYVSLNIFSQNKEPIFFKPKNNNIHITIKLEKNAEYNLVLIMPETDIVTNSLIIEAYIKENANFNLTIISKKDFLCRINSELIKKSTLTTQIFTSGKACLKSKTNLGPNSSYNLTNNFIVLKNNFSSHNTVIHEEESKSLIKSNGYNINGFCNVRGLIKICKNAQNSEGFQKFNTLLEGDAHSISVPDLEILANEVKCNHGSTISRIKEEDLFYFESRGIDKITARQIIVKSFLLNDFSNKKIIKILEKLIEEVATWLKKNSQF